MPERPDICLYVEHLKRRILRCTLRQVRLISPFLLRSVEPPIDSCEGRHVVDVRRLGKRVVIVLDSEICLIIHLMIAGRLHWRDGMESARRAPNEVAVFQFDTGTLHLTEASTHKRASLHVVVGRDAAAIHDPGGLDVMECTVAEFTEALQRQRRTLKRALTDPRTLDGIGNAFSSLLSR